MVGRLGCTIGGEGEVDGSSSRIHLEEEKRRPTARGERERRVLMAECSDT
jgi:hypothetical protein